MAKKKVVIVQDSDRKNAELTAAVNRTSDFEVSGTATKGADGVKVILETNPDVVITELLLGGGDGFYVLDKMNEAGLHSKTIIISAFSREEIVAKAFERGAAYFMAKPFAAEVLVQRMREIALPAEEAKNRGFTENLKKNTVDEKISNIFINVGIPPHIKGYSYLREGVKMAIRNPDIINSITKKLYPMIGEKYDTSASKVERAIRHAIEVAWNRGRIESLNNILGVKAYIGSEKPTNGEFIALVADKMLLERA